MNLKSSAIHLSSKFVKSFLFTCSVFISSSLFAQERNAGVRELNHIVEMMNAFSQCNQQWYFDAVQLQKALHMSTEKINENYFYCSKTQHSGYLSYSGIESVFRFPEITPDAQKHIPAYQADYIPWLETRELVNQLRNSKKDQFGTLYDPLLKYLHAADSLFSVHTELNNYVAGKAFHTDSGFREAERILTAHNHWFGTCHATADELTDALRNYYQTTFPPLKSHPELRQGLEEIELTMKLLSTWAQDLYREDLSKNAEYDEYMRYLNEQGVKRDSLYLYKTRGYGVLQSGFWLHTRYRTFYTSMQSTVYWFASSKHSGDSFVKKSQIVYNDFVRSYNATVEDYNDYIEIADGLTFAQKSSCCLSKSETDTSQNVLLMKPRLLYKFEYTPQFNTGKTDTMSEETLSHATLINNAAPHHLIYLLDASSSMNESGKLSRLKENAAYLVRLQREADRISIVTFSGKGETVLRAVPCNQKKYILEQINSLHAFGQTNIHGGFETVKILLENGKLENGVNTLLLLTDGEFSLSENTRSMIHELKANEIRICFVYLGKPMTKREIRSFEKTCANLGIIGYDVNRTNLKEALLKIATE